MDNTASGAVEAALEKAAGKAKREGTGADDKKASYARSKVLYGAEGQLNPNQSRAAKKKVKKIKAAVAKTGGEDDDGSDFEWEEQE